MFTQIANFIENCLPFIKANADTIFTVSVSLFVIGIILKISREKDPIDLDETEEHYHK